MSYVERYRGEHDMETCRSIAQAMSKVEKVNEVRLGTYQKTVTFQQYKIRHNSYNGVDQCIIYLAED